MTTPLAVWPPPGEWSGDSFDAIDAAIYSSLFSDARADETEKQTDRRGYWGDTFAEVPGDRWGSKLWLAERAKLTADPRVGGEGVVRLAQLEQWAREAVQWMIDDGVITSIEIESERREGGQALLQVTYTRERGDDPRTRFFDAVWAEKLG